MHVNGAFLEPFPDLDRRIKTAREKSENVSGHRPMAGQQKMRGQPENAAKHRGGQLRFPFIDVLLDALGAFEKFDVALDDLGKRNIAPAPEFRRGWAGHASDGGGRAVVSDGDFVLLELGQWPVAGKAIAPAAQQRTHVAGVGGLGFLKFGRDAFGQPGDIRATHRGDGDFLLGAVNGHRFERRLFGERSHDRAREALTCLAVVTGMFSLR